MINEEFIQKAVPKPDNHHDLGDVLKREKMFFENAKMKFGDRFDYSKAEFINNKTKLCIICPEHGEFWQTPANHLKGNGCPKCSSKEGGIKRGLLSRSNTEEFIMKANGVHNGKYDYSKVEYVNNSTKVCIICPEHGEFWQTPHNHLHGYGCPTCRNESFKLANIKSADEFIAEANKIHNGKYDYSEVKYDGAHAKVCIVCPEHGEFWQTPSNHLKGHGCPYCANKFQSTESFIETCTRIHNGKYDYSKVIYKNAFEKVCITCPTHGDFWQEPYNHKNGHGCPKCVSQTSKWENEVCEYLSSIGIQYVQSERTILEGYEIDIYIQSFKIGIECDGLYWHNELHKSDNYHLRKSKKCAENGIRLIHIFEDEWLFKKDILKSMLNNMFGMTNNRIYARKCIFGEVSPKDRKKFLDENHIQGDVQSKYNYGLYYNGELVSLMTFGVPRISMGGKRNKGSYELVRFCNKLNTNVIGGASKLFKHFLDKIKPNEVISYSDKRWSTGNLYNVLGFKHIHDSKPNYFYVVGTSRLNRFGFRKSILVKEGYDVNKSEREIMKERGIYRIYDCGTMVWKYVKSY